MYRFVINKRYVNLLKAIAKQGEHDVATVSKESGIAYSRISSYIAEFAREGIVIKEPLNSGPGLRIGVLFNKKTGKVVETHKINSKTGEKTILFRDLSDPIFKKEKGGAE